MAEVKNELTHPESAKRWKHTGNWNRKVSIPGVWSGPVQNAPPHAIEAMIAQGRKDFVPIVESETTITITSSTGKTDKAKEETSKAKATDGNEK